MTYFYEHESGCSFDEFTQVNLKDDEIFDRILNKRNLEGWTLLMYACNNGQKSVVEHLIKHGAQVSCLGAKTPLMLAVGNGDLDIVKIVFNHHDLEIKDSRGWTALFYAVFYGREECAEYLLQQGANVNTVDTSGRTPIHVALKSGMETMADLLRANKTEKKTPLCQTPQTKTSIFRQIRTYSPNTRSNNKKENIKIEAPPAKRLILASSPSQQPQNILNESNVLTFLKDLGLEKYWPIFRDEEIDFETLITFNEDNLADIGIKLYGPRKKLSKAIQEYRQLHGNDTRLLKSSFWLK